MNGKPLSLYIHIPFCVSRCDYCDFFSSVINGSAVSSSYIDALINEISFYAMRFNVPEWATVYIGGGTPSLISPCDIVRLCDGIKKAAPFSKNIEFTMEMNPSDVTPDILGAASSGGITRLSLGIQSFSDKCLSLVHRRSSSSDCYSALAAISRLWKGRLSLDLIAGLPYQTEKSLKEDIDSAIKSGASHISLYSLSLEEGTVLEGKISGGVLDYDSDQADALWLLGRDYLEENGFNQYEVSNFCKDGAESRHNKTYWALKSYLGAGSGATGTLYADDYKFPEYSGSVRYTNTCDIKKYIDFWTGKPFENDKACDNTVRLFNKDACSVECLERADEAFEYLMMNLRTLRGAESGEYKRRFGLSLEEKLGTGDENSLFMRWCREGKARVMREDGRIYYALIRDGLLFLNSFLENL